MCITAIVSTVVVPSLSLSILRVSVLFLVHLQSLPSADRASSQPLEEVIHLENDPWHDSNTKES